MRLLPYKGARFDAVICFQAICPQKHNTIQEDLAEIHMTMKNNGSFLTNYLSKNTYGYGKEAD